MTRRAVRLRTGVRGWTMRAGVMSTCFATEVVLRASRGVTTASA
jgi:hypothetical protein